MLNNTEKKYLFCYHMNTYAKISKFLKSIGIKKKDTVAAYLPNCIETVEAFLASSAIGAIWSSCSSDFGADAIIDRFKQIEPKILIVADYYYYRMQQSCSS